MTVMKLIASAAVASLVAVGAHAATLSVIGGAPVALPSNFGNFFNAGEAEAVASTGVADVGDIISVFDAGNNTAANGLSLSGMNELKFTFLASEAGFFNEFQVMGSTVLSNGSSSMGDSVTMMFMDGIVPIGFQSQGRFSISNTATPPSIFGIRLAFSEVFNGGQSVIAFLDDRTSDIDYDDLVIRIDVVPIPVPPAFAALATALVGIGLLGRRRATA